MKRLQTGSLVLAAAVAALALASTAAGAPAQSVRVEQTSQPIEALALDGSRVAYDAGARYLPGASNKVLVWDVRTGRTTKVSGRRTASADDTSTGAGVLQVAIAGTRVAWLVNEGGNTEGDDDVFTSSVTKLHERRIASAERSGGSCSGGAPADNPGCAGTWLGGLVGSGRLLALNRWTTGASGAVSGGGLYVLRGTRLARIADGAGTVEAVSADNGRIAVLRAGGTVALYSSHGKLLRTVTPVGAEAVALGGDDLVVLTQTRTLALYSARTGTLHETLPVRGDPKRTPGNLDVQGGVAIYTMNTTRGSSAQGVVRAVNLSNGADRIVGRLRRGIRFARIDGAGLAYAGRSSGKGSRGTIVFVPRARIAAAVSRAPSAAASAVVTAPSLVCRVGGRTTVSGVPDTVNHLRFRFWYVHRPVWTSIWVWYAPSLSHGTAFVPTKGHPTRAQAILHTKDGHLLRLDAPCS